MIYLDTCIVIYLVEEHPIFCARLEAALATNETYCLSPLVEMECLVLPIRRQRQDLITKFQIFFLMQRRLSMPQPIFHQAAELRAQHGLKTPDALHLATARHHNCTGLWTNDDRLHKVAGDMALNILKKYR